MKPSGWVDSYGFFYAAIWIGEMNIHLLAILLCISTWYTCEGSETTSQPRIGFQFCCHICILSQQTLQEFSGICPVYYVLRNGKADRVTKILLQWLVAQRVGTCIVQLCLNLKPRAIHTIEACINQYWGFLKWWYPKSPWVSILKSWLNDWMVWGYPYLIGKLHMGRSSRVGDGFPPWRYGEFQKWRYPQPSSISRWGCFLISHPAMGVPSWRAGTPHIQIQILLWKWPIRGIIGSPGWACRPHTHAR